MTLLGPKGQPISSKSFKKGPAPALGEKYGSWSGEQSSIMRLPGGGLMQFNLDNLTLGDYRQMKDNYQISSSLAILTFMMHQMEWHIECENQKIADECERQLRKVWSRLVRAKSQAFWAGYSPNVLQWENDVQNKSIVLDKIKDLIPEDCRVNWKKVDGQKPPNGGPAPKLHIYDGIKQAGSPGPIPTANSYWYSLLMDNGDYYGRKLLRTAFQPWFFSMLIHLFANRYYERFGEPTPVGRAPFEEDIDFGGKTMKGNKAMELILGQLRNRSVVVLPSEKTPFGDETNPGFDYTIEYLESTMRGGDFEKYMTRLDEEMSLALFTPILLMRTADVGSYNLGVGHMQMYLWMLNAISGDWALYINKYILAPIARMNFNENHPEVQIKFRRLGKENGELVRDIVGQGIGSGKFKPDLRELSEMSGMTLEEADELTLTDEEIAAKADEVVPSKDGATDGEIATTTGKVTARVARQVENSYSKKLMPDSTKISFGFDKQLGQAFEATNSRHGYNGGRRLFDSMRDWMEDCASLGFEQFPDSTNYMRAFSLAINHEAKRLVSEKK